MSENDCVFCKIASGEEESEVVYEEEEVMAFHSIGGEASAHVLFIPRDHVSSPEEIGQLSEGVAEKVDVAGSSYAFGINNGSDAVQEVLPARAMGGRKMEMP